MDDLVGQYRAWFGAECEPIGQRAGVSVLRIRPTRGVMLEPDSELFVTAGMSARAMKAPEGLPARAELMIAVPGGWETMYGADDFFVVDTLLTTAEYPFAHDRFLGRNHTLPAGKALDPKTQMSGWVLTMPLVLEKDRPLETPHGPASLLLMTSIHPAELALARASGTAALLQRIFKFLETLGLDWAFLLKPQRPDTVAGEAQFV